jgi:hypothetical protein
VLVELKPVGSNRYSQAKHLTNAQRELLTQ